MILEAPRLTVRLPPYGRDNSEELFGNKGKLLRTRKRETSGNREVGAGIYTTGYVARRKFRG